MHELINLRRFLGQSSLLNLNMAMKFVWEHLKNDDHTPKREIKIITDCSAFMGVRRPNKTDFSGNSK